MVSPELRIKAGVLGTLRKAKRRQSLTASSFPSHCLHTARLSLPKHTRTQASHWPLGDVCSPCVSRSKYTCLKRCSLPLRPTFSAVSSQVACAFPGSTYRLVVPYSSAWFYLSHQFFRGQVLSLLINTVSLSPRYNLARSGSLTTINTTNKNDT